VLVVGSGVYVCGRGTDGFGTVLPALAEAQRGGLVAEAAVAARAPRSLSPFRGKLKSLNRILGTRLKAEGFSGPGAHRRAVRTWRPDCAIVVTPDHTHASIASDLIRAGVHVLVVKPLAPTLKEARSLERLARKRGVYGAVEFHKRYDEANLKLKGLLQDGRLGDVSYFTVEYSQRKVVPTRHFRGWAAKTNIFQYLGVHYVDMVYFLTGAKPLRVAALGQMNWLKRRGIRTYDAVQALIEWRAPSGKPFTSALLTNWIDPDTSSAMSDQRLKLIGTRGRYESDQRDRGVEWVSDGTGPEKVNPYFSQFYPRPGTRRRVFAGYGERSFRTFLEDVRELSGGRCRPADFEGARPTFKDSLVSCAVVDAANKSLSRGGAWVKV